MFKRILAGGWALLILLAFLVVEFPNAAWNQAVSTVAWVFSIVLLAATLAFLILVAARLLWRFQAKVRPRCEAPFRQGANFIRQKPRWQAICICLAALIVFISVLLGAIEHSFKSSPIYKAAVTRAEASPAVLLMLGQPVTEGWFTSGQITESSDGSGRAALSVPLKGPKGSGNLRVEARRAEEKWQVVTLQFTPSAGNSRVDLLQERAY